MFGSETEIVAFVREFEELRLPKVRWTHHAHLVVGLWYVTRYPEDQALDVLRRRIRAYNEAVGTPNSDTGGYHETLTRLFVRGIAAHQAGHGAESLAESLARLLRSPLGRKEWPLTLYTRDRLFSVEARRGWVEPDLVPGSVPPVG